MVREVFSLQRGVLTPDTLGLHLAEAKDLLGAVQQTLVEAQAQAAVTARVPCPARRRGQHAGADGPRPGTEAASPPGSTFAQRGVAHRLVLGPFDLGGVQQPDSVAARRPHRPARPRCHPQSASAWSAATWKASAFCSPLTLVAGGPAGQFLDLASEPLELVLGFVDEAYDLSFQSSRRH